MVQFLIAGGEPALTQATESSEGSAELGYSDIARKNPGPRDVVVGLAASGSTPYTITALKYAAANGAATVAIACNRDSALGRAAEIHIEVEVGPEVLTGSSRLKAGTAQKQICNMLTTGAMARMGYVYSNLMVNLHLTNTKLQERGIAIVDSLAQVSREHALEVLESADMNVSLALVMLKANAGKSESVERLRKAKGNDRKAIEG
jgi:N-acetylmuramic acid 6-phosphate etherase